MAVNDPMLFEISHQICEYTSHQCHIPCPNYEIEEVSDWNASWQLPLNCFEYFEFHDSSHPASDIVSLIEEGR